MSEGPKKRGGARPGAGAKKKIREAPAKLDGRSPRDRAVAGDVLKAAHAEKVWRSLITIECRRLGIDPETGVVIEIQAPAKKDKDGREESTAGGNFSIIPLTNLLRYLEDRAFGRPMDTVNHLHDKPIEANVTLSLSEGMRLAMQKADERLSKRGH